jgi:hypothetical protein
METLNSNSTETKPAPVEDLAGSVPAPAPAPAAVTPPAAAAPAAPAVPAVSVTPAAAPAPAPVSLAYMVIPKTTGKTPGGWNRFAGFDRNEAKNKPKDRRDSSKRR